MPRVHGKRSGYTEFRYGEPAKPVSLAKVKALLPAGQRRAAVDRMTAIMSDWQKTPFENEASCRHGLRQGLCLTGFPWRASDAEAAFIVSEALRSFGVDRPSWEQGQPDYANETDYCSTCHGPIDEESRTRRQRFCSVECARIAIARRDSSVMEHDGGVLRSAHRFVTREAAPSRPCAYCGTAFRSDAASAKCCSLECARRLQVGDRLRKDIKCEGCGKVCKPATKNSRFCSQACNAAVRAAEVRRQMAGTVRTCGCCGVDFTPTAPSSLHCSYRCSRIMAGRAYRQRQEAVVHHFTCQCCGEGFETKHPNAKFCSRACGQTVVKWAEGKLRQITPHAFDYAARQIGARVTTDWRQAA